MAKQNVVEETPVHVSTEQFTCPNCSGIMKFDIKSQAFICSACRSEQTLKTLSDTVKEYDFNQYLEREKAAVPFEGLAMASCQNCGFEISFDEHQVAATCPMCGSTQIAAVKQHSGIPPEGIVPFKVDKQDAQNKFRKWAKSRWFAPNDFKKKFGEGALNGMYLPFWTYDASVLASYKGEGGINRKEKDKDGKEKTVTDWYPVSGAVTSYFDDIQICASDKEKNIQGILPYNTVHNTVPYAAGYLSGYYAQMYQIKADEGFEYAKKKIETEMRALAGSDIRKQYDSARVHAMDVKYSNITYKHVLLPMWSSAYGYKGKTYAYFVNGETGKVSGQRPYSAVKIMIAVLAALILGMMLATSSDTDENTAAAAYPVARQAAVAYLAGPDHGTATADHLIA